MHKNNLVLSIVVLALLITSVNTVSFSLYAGNGWTYNTIEANQSITFTNSSLPSGWGGSTYRSYYFSAPGQNSIFNTTGTITFSTVGNWTGYALFYNSTGYNATSGNDSIYVHPNLKVKIVPSTPQDVYGEQQTLTANILGGVSPYSEQWYNNTGCTSKIVNQTGLQYTTNVLNSTTSLDYCVRVNDTYGFISKANTTIGIFQNVYTPQGAIISEGNHSAVLPVSIVIANSTDYIAENVTPYSLFNTTCNGQTFTSYAISLTPTYINMSVSNTPYNLFINQSLPIGVQGCFIRLLNITWDSQLVSTAALSYYYHPVTTTTSTSTSTSTVSTISISPVSTVPITSVPTTTTIPPLEVKVSASNTPKSSNTLTTGKTKTDLGGFVIMMAVVMVIAIGAYVFLYKRKRRLPPSSGGKIDKNAMVNL